MEAKVRILEPFAHDNFPDKLKQKKISLNISSPFTEGGEDYDIQFEFIEFDNPDSLFFFTMDKKEAGLLGKLLTLYSEI